MTSPEYFPARLTDPAMYDKKGDIVAAEPMASGQQLVVAPEDESLRLTIRSVIRQPSAY